MLFYSIDFAIFLPVVFALYWFVFKKNLTVQNTLIVIASYVFYGWWNWTFLFLIFFSTAFNYTFGILLHSQENTVKRKRLLTLSVFINLGLLGFFKYYNFFVDNFVSAFSLFGKQIEAHTLSIILPVGISFYTFQTMSYTFDVYYKKLEPTRDFIAFSAFVSFFPQLLSGPIGRATHLLPQFQSRRYFDYQIAVNGMRQILWGLFKKIVVADNCGEYVNEIFNNSSEYSGSTLTLGAILYSIQIYADFSGYSDVAIGTSKLFGFNLKPNFAYPNFSRDVAEYWRRWHISLSTWFRDYVYYPLGGSRGSTWMKVRNTFAVFLLSGFWHGANWTFIVWGGLHAISFLPLLLTNSNRKNIEIVASDKMLPSLNEIRGIVTTFLFMALARVFFRSESLTQAFDISREIFSPTFFNGLEVVPNMKIFAWIVLLFVLEWIGRKEEFPLASLGIQWKRVFRYGMYYAMMLLILYYSGREQDFIYFQF